MAGNARLRIAVLIGAEPYQAHHVADIAFELAERDGVDLEIVALLPEALDEVRRLERNDSDRRIPKRLLDIPAAFRALQALRLFGSLKVPIMRHNRALLSSYDAIVTPTDHLRFARPLLRPLPRLVYTNHGIGGRAASYSDAALAFDFVLLPGAADEQRLLEDRRIRPGHYAVIGYPKFESARRVARKASPMFADDRPVVLFNSHSKRSLRSWEAFARPLIEHAARSGEFNLIVAPHVKLFARRPKWLWRRWQKLAVPGRVIVDLGSPRSLDMSYTMAADIYAGDVSSQVYEFLDRPKPVVFLNPHRLRWEGNPDFPNWPLGDVVETADDAVAAIRAAGERHRLYADRQRERMAAVVDATPGAAVRAADALLAFLRSSRRSRPMFLISDLGTGGTARATVLTVNGLAALGYDVSLGVIRGGGAVTAELDRRVKLFELRSGAPRGPAMLSAVPELVRLVRSEQPTHLVSAGNHMHVAATLAHRLARVAGCGLALKITNPIERGAGGKLSNRVRRGWYRWAFSRADRVLVIASSAEQELARSYPGQRDKLRFVANPYVTEAMLAAGAAGRDFTPGRLLAIGRLAEQKNYPLMFEALGRIAGLDWTLDILGDGPLLEHLRREAARLGLAERITFHGFVPDPVPFLRRAQALILSSSWEGQVAVLPEALACGCPVIATRSTASVADILGDGRFGRLVPPGDASALAAAIAAELEQPTALPPETRSWIERFEVAAGVRSHADALDLT